MSIIPQELSTTWRLPLVSWRGNGHADVMSKKSRAIKKARQHMQTGAPPVTKVRGPADIIAMIPYLLGFQPAESLVAVALEGQRRRFGPCFRLDLVHDVDEAQREADYALSIMRHHGFAAVLIVAFSRYAEPADTVTHAILGQLRAEGVEVVEAVRADGHRWWSYICSNPECCNPEGTTYDVTTSAAAADAVLCGMQRAPDRETLRGQFEPADAERRAAVQDAIQQLSGDETLDGSPGGPELDAHVEAAVARPESLSVHDVAWLALAVNSSRAARDRVWSMMTRANATGHLSVWRRVMREVPDPLMPPAGSLAAFAGWLSGQSVLASHAADRVLAVDGDYSMALLVVDALERVVSPREWDRIRELMLRDPSVVNWLAG